MNAIQTPPTLKTEQENRGVIGNPASVSQSAGYFFETLPTLSDFYHIAENQPFIDGNKRAGLLSALNFLAVNAFLPINRSTNSTTL